MTTFDAVHARWNWKAIPDCPGRYVLRGAASNLSIEQVAGEALAVHEVHATTTADTILVAPFEGGGLLSFRKPDGSIVHTLNTPEGLARRLALLELADPVRAPGG
ncbi:MAG: hypothetical protein JW940_09075 [Polyangiaceae bacterium]|nr:hypothetical protein [Polyangiaceae bacterium]